MSGSQSFPDFESGQISESVIVKSSQRRYFSIELGILEEKGLLRTGGQIQKLVISEKIKHPVLITRNSEIAAIIIR